MLDTHGLIYKYKIYVYYVLTYSGILFRQQVVFVPGQYIKLYKRKSLGKCRKKTSGKTISEDHRPTHIHTTKIRNVKEAADYVGTNHEKLCGMRKSRLKYTGYFHYDIELDIAKKKKR